MNTLKQRIWITVVFFLLVTYISAEAATKLKVGVLAPSFILKDLKGETVKSKEFFPKYKLTVLILWDSCCANCMRAVARSEVIFERTKKKFEGVTVLGINFDKTNLAAVRAFVKGQKITYPTLLDPQNRISTAYGAELNNVSFFIIDNEGIVRYIYFGHPPNITSIIEKELEKLLGVEDKDKDLTEEKREDKDLLEKPEKVGKEEERSDRR